MDKKSVLAIVLITVIILLLPMYYELINRGTPPVVLKPEDQKTTGITDTGAITDDRIVVSNPPSNPQPEAGQVEEVVSGAGVHVESDQQERFTEIETPLVHAKISNRGGGRIYYYYLKNYNQWDKTPVKIIDESLENGFDFQFLSALGQSQKVQLDHYYFFTENDRESVTIDENSSFSVSYFINYNDSEIEKRITFYGNQYHLDLQFYVREPQGLFLNKEYQLIWENGLPSNEENRVEDFSYSEIYASMGDELESKDITSEGEIPDKNVTGLCSWVAIRTKYFVAALIPLNVQTNSVTFGGSGVKVDDVVERRYSTSLNIFKSEESKIDSFSVYLGPLDNSILDDYGIGLNRLVLNHGWYEQTFRIISLPIVDLLKFLYQYVPNYGIVIVIFSILIKILVYPLTKKSYRSMKEMSKIQPLLLELKEKYKGDPQRYQRETMKLYKEHGVNPLGGCLPILLQLPLLAALFIVFRSTIQLRGASFIPGWIDDLSSADTLFKLPFSLPFYGNQFNLLPILMTVSMIIQSKMTMQDPKQKAMIYIMPIFMLFLFNQFPSGLNLYYTLFNIWTILQQKFIDNRGSVSSAPVVNH
jgi:YidC/Oxa1 family membrane protein insertase